MSLHVNFSEDEAKSEAQGGELIPRGEYLVRITDGELRESKSEKNAGKPYYNLEFTIQDGKYQGRKLWTNVMLFQPALYSLSQLMKAIGIQVRAGTQMEVPTIEELMSKEVVVTTKVKPADDKYDARTEVNGIKPANAMSGTGPGAKQGAGRQGSLLPG
jgi:hypothetical protein